jgi:hypothetical protein
MAQACRRADELRDVDAGSSPPGAPRGAAGPASGTLACESGLRAARGFVRDEAGAIG